MAGAVRFVPQARPRGYGHAIYCAREFVGSDPFLHMVGDHLYVSAAKLGAAAVVEMAEAEACVASRACRPRGKVLLPQYGAVAGRRVPGRQGLYRVDTVIEKPTPTEAEQRLVVPGMRAGYYLCFFGIHVLTPAVMELLGSALAELRRRSRSRFRPRWPNWRGASNTWRSKNTGGATTSASRYGLLIAQMALALNGRDRDEVLAHWSSCWRTVKWPRPRSSAE